MKSKWIITCEHGGNQIPPAYALYFQNSGQLLETHRGYDPGALELFHLMAGELADFSHFSRTSRLLVELNRSLHHKNLFSAITKPLPPAKKQEILANFYHPYRTRVEEQVRHFRDNGFKVIHISVHSFTPELDGETRNADIGLLYDPSRAGEKNFCESWKKTLLKSLFSAKVRMNYPYHGKADGFTTYLRKNFPEGYLGMELEVNQKHAHDSRVNDGIVNSLQQMKDSVLD